ncbi:ARM repeat-containing protein [Coprinopsis marcescibilis]|uniref:ARM repeat-containing protein n=1 Tax=Coprinopsis marcescibilis TaxID=230819 RepID=A0A5C3KPB3_COPMA|nr:ARM repeat-containing protein [Coprinopsis marcescibilis]
MSDSDSSPPSSVVDDNDELDAAVDEDEDEAPEALVPIEASEIPEILKGIDSEDQEVFDTSQQKLGQLLDNQQDLFIKHILPEIPRFLKDAAEAKVQNRRDGLIDIVSQVASIEEGREAIKANLTLFLSGLFTSKAIEPPKDGDLDLWLRLNPAAANRYRIISALESILREDESFEPKLVEAFSEQLFNIPDDFDDADWSKYTEAAEIFQFILASYEEGCRNVAIKASVYEFIINLTASPDPKARVAAITSLAAILERKDDLREAIVETLGDDSEQFADPNAFHVMTILPILNFLKDKDKTVTSAAVQFLQNDGSEETKVAFFVDDDAPRALVLLLKNKDPNTIGDSIDWVLGNFVEEQPDIIAEGFRKAFEGEDVEFEDKLAILPTLSAVFDKVKQAARKGGLAEFLLKALDNAEHRLATLKSTAAMLNDDDILAYHVIQAQGIPQFLDLFENGSTIEEQTVAASILSALPKARAPTDGDEDNLTPYRDETAAALTTDTNLPRIHSALQHADPKIASAAFNLLASILDIGPYIFPDEDDPAPLKDRIITPELVELAVGKLQAPDGLGEAALALLCEICRYYKRGLELAQKTFEGYIPKADASFFVALDGTWSTKHQGRKHWRVATAAVNAGGIQRVVELLETQQFTTIESRRAIVEAFRVLLCAEDVDNNDVARHSEKFAALLAELLADGTYDSLNLVRMLVRLLSVNDVPEALGLWSEALGTEETVKHLLGFLGTELVVYPEPDAEKLGEEEHTKAVEGHALKTTKAEERFTNTISNAAEILTELLPILSSHKQLIVPALLVRANNSDDRRTLSLLEKLGEESASDETSLEPLVKAAKELLALPSPPSTDKLETWFGYGLAKTFYLAGVVPFLLEKCNVPASVPVQEGEEEEVQESNSDLVADIIGKLSYLARKLLDEADRRELQAAFYAHGRAVEVAVEVLKDIEERKWAAEAMVGYVFQLSKGYPEAIAVLEKADVFTTVLKLVDDDEVDASAAQLLGILAGLDPAAVTEMLKKLVEQLKPPAGGQPSTGGAKKKKKKKGKYRPRIGKEGVLSRLAFVSTGSDVGTKAVVDAGGVALAVEVLNEADPDSLWAISLKCLNTLLAREDPSGVEDLLVPILPRVVEIFGGDDKPESAFEQLFVFIRAFIRRFNVQHLLDAKLDATLVTEFSVAPSSFPAMALIIDTVAELAASGDAGRNAVVGRFKERIADEQTWESEHNWGTTHALRRLLVEGDAAAKTALDTGALDYAIKLLKSSDRQFVVKGAALATSLVLAPNLDVLPLVQEKGVPKLVEDGKAEVTAFLETPLDDAEPEDEKERREQASTWAEHYNSFVKILNGERLEYEQYYWL